MTRLTHDLSGRLAPVYRVASHSKRSRLHISADLASNNFLPQYLRDFANVIAAEFSTGKGASPVIVFG